MRSRSELHRHVVLATGGAAAADVAEPHAPNGISLLRLSVTARLFIVALAAALLWTAVLWALR
jgi:hypothetical protein